jgi:hypothetical protein
VRAALGRGVLLRLGVCLLFPVVLAATASAGPPERVEPSPFVIGVDDDHAKWLARPDGLVAKYRDLGLEAVRITIPWRRGQSRPTNVRVYLHRAAMMIERGQRVVISVFGRPSDAPLDAASRRQYCGFLHYVLVRIPFRDVAIWNEANSPQFWPQAAGAPAYEELLSACWRRLHALRPNVNVIATTAARHDPAGFVRLLDAIRDAFSETAQPLPGEGRTSVWYLETGFQTTIPREKRRFYRGEETDRFVVPPLAPDGAEPWVRDQASQLRDALLLARCQTGVGAFFNFELLDEDRLAGWQSGVLWRDGTNKASYGAFKAAVELVRSGELDCSTVPGAGGPLPPAVPKQTPEDLG